MDKPQPSPEAVLIRVAREAARISVATAAGRAGISPARWTQIEQGHESRAGIRSAARAPAGTLAHMAAAVGVTAERIEEAGRPDAGAVLREMRRPAAPAPELSLIDRLAGLPSEDLGALFVEAIRRGMEMRERGKRDSA